jgi:hypothetical protein
MAFRKQALLKPFQALIEIIFCLKKSAPLRQAGLHP